MYTHSNMGFKETHAKVGAFSIFVSLQKIEVLQFPAFLLGL